MPYISLQFHHMHHSVCFTCYICPHILCYKCPLCSPLVICMFEPYSTYTKPTCTCFTPTYTSYLLFVTYQKTKKRAPWCKHFTSVLHAHGEALLRATSTVFNRGSISRFEEEAELTEEDEHNYKLPSCVTVKT